MELRDMTFEEYNEDKTGFRSGWIKKLLEGTPQEFNYSLDNPEQKKAKPMDLGSLTHALTCEDNISRFIVTPPFNYGNGVGKAEYHKYLHDLDSEAFLMFMDEHQAKPKREDCDQLLRELLDQQGKIVVDQDMLAKAVRMKDSVMRNPTARKWIEKGIPEQTSFYRDEYSGVLCKARADLWVREEQRSLVADLKITSLGMSDNALSKTILNFGYHSSMCHYIPAFEADEFNLIFVSTEEPFFYVRVIELWKSDAWVKLGSADRYKALDIYRKCVMRNEWPGHSEEPTVLEPPRWARESIELEYVN